MESQQCVPRSRDAHKTIRQPRGHPGQLHLRLQEGHSMASKDKNTKKSMEKKPAQKTLKEKRQAKKAKR